MLQVFPHNQVKKKNPIKKSPEMSVKQSHTENIYTSHCQSNTSVPPGSMGRTSTGQRGRIERHLLERPRRSERAGSFSGKENPLGKCRKRVVLAERSPWSEVSGYSRTGAGGGGPCVAVSLSTSLTRRLTT